MASERPRDERPAEAPSGDAQDLVFRRGKLRKRDDLAIDLFREAQAHLDDLPRVRGILLELGRLYNPVTNAPILAPGPRHRVIALLEAGAADDARSLLEQCVKEYTRFDRGPGP